MKKIVFACLSLTVLANCKTNEKQEEKNSQIEAPVEIVEKKGPALALACYTYDANGDHIVLEITKINDSVLGNLDYALYEKDSNKGTFAGVLRDSVLIGSYTFMSEGIKSAREVAYLVKEDQLLEGYGELDETGTLFKNKDFLSFSSSMPLGKSECGPEF